MRSKRKKRYFIFIRNEPFFNFIWFCLVTKTHLIKNYFRIEVRSVDNQAEKLSSQNHSKKENLINLCVWRIINVSFVLVNVIWWNLWSGFRSLKLEIKGKNFLGKFWFQNGWCRNLKNHQIYPFVVNSFRIDVVKFKLRRRLICKIENFCRSFLTTKNSLNTRNCFNKIKKMQTTFNTSKQEHSKYLLREFPVVKPKVYDSSRNFFKLFHSQIWIIWETALFNFSRTDLNHLKLNINIFLFSKLLGATENFLQLGAP